MQLMFSGKLNDDLSSLGHIDIRDIHSALAFGLVRLLPFVTSPVCNINFSGPCIFMHSGIQVIPQGSAHAYLVSADYRSIATGLSGSPLAEFRENDGCASLRADALLGCGVGEVCLLPLIHPEGGGVAGLRVSAADATTTTRKQRNNSELFTCGSSPYLLSI